MRELERIEELLEKYYRGETSTGEEDLLRRFFEGTDIPEHLEAEQAMFRYFTGQRAAVRAGLEDQLENMVHRQESKPSVEGRGKRWRRYYWVSGIAAVIIILLGIFLDLKMGRHTGLVVRKDTYEDPYLAYAEAKKALYLVSEKMNTGRESLKNLEKLDEGVQYMQPVLSFRSGMQYLEEFNKIEETRKLLSN